MQNQNRTTAAQATLHGLLAQIRIATDKQPLIDQFTATFNSSRVVDRRNGGIMIKGWNVVQA